jgi:hypothetical protein
MIGTDFRLALLSSFRARIMQRLKQQQALLQLALN